ncbi:MAG TPA: hypothetical protein EYP24_03950, partial [bacterium (Candidatus Stahlbacteria)]|nr:hypothetical protein [Candidatus Stahlbacteria bacterium]
MRRILLLSSIIVIVVLVITITRKGGGGESPLSVPESEEWMGVYLKGKKIGYSYTRIGSSEGGYEIENRIKWDLYVMGMRQTINAYVLAHTDSSFILKDFYLDFQSPGDHKRLKGRFSTTEFELKLATNGGWRTEKRKIARPPILPDALERILLREGLKPGHKFKISFFDPITQAIQEVEGEVKGKERISYQGGWLDATRIDVTVAGMLSKIYLDENNQVIKQETSYGMVMIREDRAQALKEISPEEAMDIIYLFRVKTESVIHNPREVRYLTLEVKNLDTAGLDLEDDVQKILKTKPLTVEIDLRESLPKHPPQIPIKRFKEDLKPTVYIQSDDPMVLKKAKEIAG